MKQWLWISMSIVGLIVFSRGSAGRQPNVKLDSPTASQSQLSTKTACLAGETSLLPKLIKARSFVTGNPLLLKVSQPKHSGPESCVSETNEVGWQSLHYSFPSRTPLKVSIYSTQLGGLLWKTDRSFTLDHVTLIKKQAEKEIYWLSIHDPSTQMKYEFELNMDTSRVLLRILP